jgi:nucleotide-binding universal stress UspA family protein
MYDNPRTAERRVVHEARARGNEESKMKEVIDTSISPEVSTDQSAGTPKFSFIVRAVTDLSADLVVISTHGYTGWKHLLFGSDAEKIVEHAPCPILVVR